MFRLGPYTVPAPYGPIIIAELGINMNGSLDTARRLVDLAADAGAHVAKIQTHMPEDEMLPGHPLWDVLATMSLPLEAHLPLMEHCQDRGIMFLSTPFCWQAADFLEQLGLQAFKLGSGELTNWPLQRHVAAKRKPMIISTGMATTVDIGGALKQIEPLNRNIAVMNCASTYPAKPAESRLLALSHFRTLWPHLIIGQSDHTPGIATALGATALGAQIIEKHITLNKGMAGPDHAASIDAGE